MTDLRTLARGIRASELAAAERGRVAEKREWLELVDAAVAIVEAEPEPEAGEMPPEIIWAVLRQDTVAVETALIAAVRATKRSIADAIRDTLAQPGAGQGERADG